jgi:hypothetical protein
MKKSKWPDFLFTIAVRFVCGIVLGGLACFVVSWRGILRAFSHDHTQWPLVWLGICGLVGGIVAVFTVPRWQTPWYKRNSDELIILDDSVSLGADTATPGPGFVQKSVTIEVVGEDGQKHKYASMEEVPPEVRAQIEPLEKETAQAVGDTYSVTETSQTGNAITSKIIQRKSVSAYKVVDESGVERTYRSLEEMPPELRTAIAEAEKGLRAK